MLVTTERRERMAEPLEGVGLVVGVADALKNIKCPLIVVDGVGALDHSEGSLKVVERFRVPTRSVQCESRRSGNRMAPNPSKRH